jgi:RNA polymerase sigma factor (TIGR02999 family)
VGEATLHLQKWHLGDQSARNALLEMIYRDLHQRAARLLARHGACSPLQPTELVNESFLKLTGLNEVSWQDRNHFLAVASRVMRQVLTDSYRHYSAQKRAGQDVTLATEHLAVEPTSLLFEELEHALQELSHIEPELTELVELKFFGGMTNQEIAAYLEQSESTVKRNWRAARAWLLGRLTQADVSSVTADGLMRDV